MNILQSRSRSTWRSICAVLVTSLLFSHSPVSAQGPRATVDGAAVRRAISRGIKYLEKRQSPESGAWPEIAENYYPGGITCLCTLALLHAGRTAKDRSVSKALDYIRGMKRPRMVYVASLQIMVFAEANQKQDLRRIRKLVEYLESIQISKGGSRGGWAYHTPAVSARDVLGRGDESNSQYALLALHEAERVGIDIKPRTWTLAKEYWSSHQLASGGWGYRERNAATGSMTCAGIASLIIASGKLKQGDARVEGDVVHCCQSQNDNEKVQRGLKWIGKKFLPNSNPGSSSWWLYYMYGVERAGRLSGNRFLGQHDWYRAGAEALIAKQDQFEGFWLGTGRLESRVKDISTAFALLFLSKGRRPVVMAKLQYDDGSRWDKHRMAVQHLTESIEKSWKKRLTWQSIDVRTATVRDLLEAPVLFISGSGPFKLSAADKKELKEYVEQGGFLFAERCCGGDEFERDFKALMKELFPNSPLRPIPPDHAVWYAQHKIPTQHLVELYGLDACCRTGVIYSRQNLSCYWEVNDPRRFKSYSAKVRSKVDAYTKIGINVVSYATNRVLKEKLDLPPMAFRDSRNSQPQRGVLTIPKVSHGGGSDDAPNALSNLLDVVHQQVQMRVNARNRLVKLTDKEISDFPVLFMHGRRAFRFSPAERKALKTYIDRGGFIFGDAICANSEFAKSFKREMEAIFPKTPFNRIPPGHPIFTREFQGFNLKSVTLRDPKVKTGDGPLEVKRSSIAPYLQAIEANDRIAVIFSPYDMSCALENQESLECKGYIRQDAAKLGVNIILFALQQ